MHLDPRALRVIQLARMKPAIAAPFALFVALGLVLAREPSIRAQAEIERERQLESRHVDLFVEL